MNRMQMIITICVAISLYIAAFFICARKIKSKNKTRIATGILGLIAIGLYVGFAAYTSFGNYDRYGNRYSSFTQVIYFTENGKKYQKEGDFYNPNGEIYYVNINNSNDRHAEAVSFITKDSFIFFDDSGKKVKSANKEDVSLYIDENGTVCYGAGFVMWGWTGGIIGHFWGLK